MKITQLNFAEKANGNSVGAFVYFVLAVILALADKPLAAATMMVCCELSAVCAAIYRTASQRSA